MARNFHRSGQYEVGGGGFVVPETSHLRIGTNRCAGNCPIPKKRNVAFLWLIFCRVLADEAGLFSVTTERKLVSLAGPGLGGHAVVEAAEGRGLKMGVISSKQMCSE